MEEFYPVVGVLEDLEVTFLVLEEKLPVYFSRASNVYSFFKSNYIEVFLLLLCSFFVLNKNKRDSTYSSTRI